MASDLKLAIKLTGDGKDLHGAIVVAEKDLDKLSHASKKADKNATALAGSIKNLAKVAAAVAFAKMGVDIFRAGEQMRALNNTFQVAAGSIEGAKKEMDFVREEAKRLGLELSSTAKQYASLAAAAKDTSLEGQGTRDIFSAVSSAMTVLGRNSADTAGALNAIQQMISKGNVQAEELRGQLGERLPGAFQLAAKAMGVTTVELNKMLDNGQVLADDLLPQLAKVLKEQYGAAAERAASSATAEWNRLKTTFFETYAEIAGSGFNEFWADTFRIINDGLSSEKVKNFATAVGTAFDFIAASFSVVKENIQGLSPTFQGAGSDLVNSFRIAFNTIIEGVKAPVNAFVAAMKSIVDVSILAGEGLTKAFVNAFGEIGKRLDSFDAAFRAILTGNFKDVGRNLSAMLSTEFDLGLSETAGKMGDSIKDNFSKDWAGDVASAVGKGLTSEFNMVAGAIGEKMAERQKKRYAKEMEKTAEAEKAAKKFEKTVNKSTKAYDAQIKKLEEHNKELKLSIAYGDDVAEMLMVEAKLRSELGDLTEEQTRKIRELYAETRELEEVKKAAGEWEEIWEDAADGATDYMTDSFRESLDEGKLEFKDFGDALIDIMKDVAAEIARMLIFKPAVSGIMSSIGLPGYGAGIMGNAAGIGGGIAGIGSALGAGLGSVAAYSGGTVGAIGAGLSAYSLGSNLLSGGMSLTPALLNGNAAVASALYNATGSMAVNDAALAFTSPLASLGGFAANLLINSILGDRGTGTSAGSIAGGIAGSFLGPVGSIVGSALGNVVGGLVTGKKREPAPPNVSGVLNLSGGSFRASASGINVSQSTTDNASRFLIDVAERLKDFRTEVGGKFTGEGRIIRLSETDEFNFKTAVDEAIRNSIGKGILSVAPALERLIEDADRGIEPLSEAVNVFLSAQKAFEDSMKSMISGKDELTQAETALKNLEAQFTSLRNEATDLGVSLNLVKKAEAAQRKAFVDNYNDNTRLAILSILDPFQAAIEGWGDWAEGVRREAEVIGADMVQVEELIALRRLSILEQYGQEIEAGEKRISETRKAALNDTLNAFLDELYGSTQYGTSAVDALAYTQAEFDSLKAEALGGSAEAIDRLDDVAKQMLTLLEAVYAHSPEYYAGRSAIENSIGEVQDALPAFAAGGEHSGGLMLVGERGPEIVATGAARIWNAEQTRKMAGGNTEGIEIRLDRMNENLKDYRGQDAKQTEILYQAVLALKSEMENIRRRQLKEAA